MKPENWNLLTMEEKVKIAMNLVEHGMRGKYIIGQALAVAANLMRKEPHPEVSNIQDMEMLGETLFNFGYFVTNMERGWK